MGEGAAPTSGTWSGLSVTSGDLLGFLSDFRVAKQPDVEPAEEPENDPAEDWEAPGPGGPAPRRPQPAATWTPPSNPPAPSWSPPQQRAPAGFAPPAPTYSAPPNGNPMASTSLGLGLGSLLMPLLTIPGLVLGIKSLALANRLPWVGGRGRAIAGIVTSLVLGPIVSLIVVLAVLNAAHHEDMSKVQGLVASMVRTQVQQATGTTPNVQVQCPSSEPRRSGVVFYCQVTNEDNGQSIALQVRETDSSGDVIVTSVSSETS